MHFHPDIDQRALIADAFSRPLDDLLPIARLHQSDAAEPWEALAELGLFGVVADPDIGGVGLGPVEETLLATELGYRLAGPQILATIMAFHVAQGEVRDSIVQGATRVAPAIVRGDVVTILGGKDADQILMLSAESAFLVPASALTGVPIDDDYWTIDMARAAGMPGEDGASPAGALLRIRLVMAGALCGLARRALEMGVDYAKLREQFGHPIGAFQAIKHHCANMATASLAANDLATFAAVALADGRADAPFQIEAALLLAIDAALGNARKNVQIHGGIGFSSEADPHLIVKRAHLLVEMAGGAEHAAERVALAEAPLGR